MRSKLKIKEMNRPFDDETLGPLYKDTEKYNIEQLKYFVHHLARKCFWFTEQSCFLCLVKPKEFLALRDILYDYNLCRIRCEINRCNNPSKNLYLRLLQCFINGLNRNGAILEFEYWFEKPESLESVVEPPVVVSVEPLFQKPNVLPSVINNPTEFFNPNDPNSSAYFLNNPFE